MRWNGTGFEEFKRLIPAFVWLACFVFVLGLLLFSHFIIIGRSMHLGIYSGS
jgi:signal peptidase I